MKTPKYKISVLSPAAENGAALVMSMVILLVLTILGVSALRTSSLEQLMSGNIQEITRSLQTADSGASKVLIDLGTFNSIPSSGSNYQDVSYNVTGPNDDVRATARIYRAIDVQITNNMTQRGNRPVSGQKTGYAFLDQVIQGRTMISATTPRAQAILQQGVRKPAPPNNSEFVN